MLQVTRVANERTQQLLDILLEHPFLHDGLTAEAAFNYLLGRTHFDRRQEKWRTSVRAFAFWLKKNGFLVVRKTQVNRYFWPQQDRDHPSEPVLS